MSDEKLANAMQEGRLIAACENLIYPLIDSLISSRVNRMTGNFRANKNEDLIGDAAYIAALQELKNTLQQKQTAGNKAYKALSEE